MRTLETKFQSAMRHFLHMTAFIIAPLLLTMGVLHAEDALQKVRFGFIAKAVSPLVIDYLIPEYLGYYKAEGLTTEFVPLNSMGASLAGLDSGRIEFSTSSAQIQLPVLAKGDKLPSIDFFESTYPFKYSMAVQPGSAIHTLADIKGKRIGVPSLGEAGYPVARAVLTLLHIDPDKDVSWLAVGEGVTAGIALQRGDVDALWYFDTGFGTIEAAGIAMNYLALPPGIPEVGGLFAGTTPALLQAHRAWAVGLGRAVAKAHVFIRENPEAAAYVFSEMFPEAVPKGKSPEEQVKAVMVPVAKRMAFYKHYDKSIKLAGFSKAEEWQDELKFANLQDKGIDVSKVYTNDLIADINKFDVAKVKAEAHNYKLPYKK